MFGETKRFKMHRNRQRSKRHNQAKVLAGLFIITFGVLFLLERQGLQLGDWVISWKTILIAVGIVTLYKHNFKHFFGYVLIGVGSVFLINEYQPNTIDSKLILPVVVIMFGILMIGKATNMFGFRKKKSPRLTVFDDDREISSDDYIEATTFFGGVNKSVVSKNFQGADFTTMFGGTEINLSKADIQHPVDISATTAFGGITLIVPSNWQVNSEITTVFGAVEDQRNLAPDHQVDPEKTVTLKGSCFFGGVEIQSYV